MIQNYNLDIVILIVEVLILLQHLHNLKSLI